MVLLFRISKSNYTVLVRTLARPPVTLPGRSLSLVVSLAGLIQNHLVVTRFRADLIRVEQDRPTPIRLGGSDESAAAAGQSSDYAVQRERMVRDLIAARGVKDERVLAAMRKVAACTRWRA